MPGLDWQLHGRLVERLLKKINTQFEWRSDQALYGKREKWQGCIRIGDKLLGDCDDHAIECYRALRAAGIARRHLTLGVCRVNRSQPHYDHAVGLIRTNEGIKVIDNISPLISDIGNKPYDLWRRGGWDVPITRPWIKFEVS